MQAYKSKENLSKAIIEKVYGNKEHVKEINQL
jgi:hypothetical protein